MLLKGVGKINGDGWKDSTQIGEVVFVYSNPLPAPYIGFNGSRQYERVGNVGWTASTDQYEFTKAGLMDIVRLVFVMIGDLKDRRYYSFRRKAA